MLRSSKHLFPARFPTKTYMHFLGAFAKLRKGTASFVLSVCPHGTTRLPLDGFSWNLLLVIFRKIFRENSSLVKIWQE